MNRILAIWLGLNFPDIRRFFSFHTWPIPAEKLERILLLIPWIQDPIPSWSATAEAEIADLQARLALSKIATFNAPSAQRQLIRSQMARALATLDLRVPRVWPLNSREDWERAVEESAGALVIRKDWGHGGNLVRLLPAEMPSWEALPKFAGVVAVEFIDTSDENGIFWKYRCLCAGSRQISVHAIGSTAWEVRGTNKLSGRSERQREAEYMSAVDSSCGLLALASRLLSLDLVAFDYGRDQAGKLVLWEGNPNPGISFQPHSAQFLYRHTAFHRAVAAIFHAYFEKAGLAPPEPLDALTRYDARGISDKRLARLKAPD